MSNFSNVLAYKTLTLLEQRKALLYEDGTAFYLWPLVDRAVIVFDADAINLSKVNDEFAHDLSSRLNGRRVVRTNSRGVFLQVGYTVPPALMDLTESPLDLSQQPTSLSIPIGMTGRGPLWLDLVAADSILLGGSRGMGKTGMLHGWIQSLLYGGQTEVRAWDGKDGSEFGRYADHPQFVLLTDLEASLRELNMEAIQRRGILRRSGHPNAQVYNQRSSETMTPIALIIDEAALVRENARPLLAELVERCRDTGVHPIFGTNNPQQSQLVVKSNLVTRVSLAVPTLAASVMVLGFSGAEKLPKQRGRGLVEMDARMTEFQAFRVTYPAPSEQALEIIREMPKETLPVNEIQRMAESIREKWEPGMSKRKTAELLGKTYAGAFAEKVDRIIDILTATTTTRPVFGADLGLNQAVAE